jgi:sugar transferase (PEP-CTERM system associated)
LIRLLSAYFPKRTLFLGISEACLVSLAFVAAAITRLGGSDAGILLAYPLGFSKILVVTSAFVTCMYYFDLYDSSIVSNRREVVIRLIQVIGTVYAVLAVLYYLYPPVELGRGIFQIGFVFVATLLWLWRKLFSALNSVPQLAERTLILGEGSLVEPLLQEFESRPELGVRVVGHVGAAANGIDRADGGHEDTSGDPLGIDRVDESLPWAIKRFRAKRIVVAMGDRRGKLPVELLLSLKSRGVRVQDGNEVYEAITGKVPIESVRLGWLLFSPGCYASQLFLAYKRFASLVVSTVGLLLSLPLLPFIVLAIKLTSPGPVMYRQKRVGRDGAVFECCKFRTMRADAEADIGPTWALDDDPRITRVGKFLRLSRMDEIPQLWNVLRGDMSMVGPRPERPEFVDALSREIPYYQLRHTVRPGITGWAQVRYKYGRSIEDSKEKLRYDLFYIKNMSIGLDLLTFIQTLKVILVGRGAK